MKSPFDKVVKPQDKHKVSQAGSLSKKTAQPVPPETKKLENVVETETKTEDEKRRAEEAKQQKKEETSEERYMRVTISEEEENHLNRVFQLFINEQKQLEKETREKKHHTRNGIEDAEINEKREMEIGAGKSSIIKKDKKDKEEEYFEGKAVRAILSKLGVKEIREHDIEIMIWEVDENLDWKVNKREFELMYKKCVEDQMGLEPRNLFNLVQFLMFCK